MARTIAFARSRSFNKTLWTGLQTPSSQKKPFSPIFYPLLYAILVVLAMKLLAFQLGLHRFV
jgi:hypothetical protein